MNLEKFREHSANDSKTLFGREMKHTWHDILEVPENDEVQKGIQKHHVDARAKTICIIRQRTFIIVIPLDANALLFPTCNVSASHAKTSGRKKVLLRKALFRLTYRRGNDTHSNCAKVVTCQSLMQLT